MPNLQPQHFGKYILITGIVISVIGGIIILLGKMGISRLPGDISIEGKNWKIYFPVISCIVISFILTVILWIVGWLRK
ncbi:MAG: DUF2905 domain-containing protein [Sedimentisphaerales bacterium]